MSENKTGKYFKYAIGEIILVVIGILIALQINNWNENRINLITEKATLNRFLQDLQSDYTYFQNNSIRIKDIDQLHKDLFKIGFKDAKDTILKHPNYIRRQLIYTPIAKANNPDITSQTNNNSIRENIQDYYRQMSDAQESNDEHDAIVYEIRTFLRAKKIHRPEAWFESHMSLDVESTNAPDIITSQDLIYLSKDEDFQQLLFESSLKLNEARATLDLLIESNTALMVNIRNYIND